LNLLSDVADFAFGIGRCCTSLGSDGRVESERERREIERERRDRERERVS